jgi:hypothetical protein
MPFRTLIMQWVHSRFKLYEERRLIGCYAVWLLASLVMEALNSSETSVLTRGTRPNIAEVDILHSHRCENLKSYMLQVIFLREMVERWGMLNIKGLRREELWPISSGGSKVTRDNHQSRDSVCKLRFQYSTWSRNDIHFIALFNDNSKRTKHTCKRPKEERNERRTEKGKTAKGIWDRNTNETKEYQFSVLYSCLSALILTFALEILQCSTHVYMERRT